MRDFPNVIGLDLFNINITIPATILHTNAIKSTLLVCFLFNIS